MPFRQKVTLTPGSKIFLQREVKLIWLIYFLHLTSQGLLENSKETVSCILYKIYIIVGKMSYLCLCI